MIYWMSGVCLCPWPTFHTWVTMVRKKWLSLYYSTYWCYILPNLHQLFIMTWSTDATWWFVSLTYISRFSDHCQEEMVKSVLQYLLVLHSPNLHQLFIMTWSTDATWWFVSLTYISRFSDHCQEEMVKSILQYLLVLHSPNLHQLFIMTWSTDATWWFVSLTYISRFSDHCQEEMVKSVLQYLLVLHSPNLHQLFILTWFYWCNVVVCVLDLHFTLEWPWLGRNG